jgi:hypothetical protein
LIAKGKRKQAGVCSGLQNRRAAPLVSPVRSTRTRFRQFIFSGLERTVGALKMRFCPRNRVAVMKT